MTSDGNTVSLWFAFAAGLLTFLSPCILPLIPAYISFMTGVSVDELKEKNRAEIRKKTLISSTLFVLGFSLVFVLLGASASFLGQFVGEHKAVISKIGGGLIIIFGLYITGIIKLDFLGKVKRFDVKSGKGSRVGSFIMGVTFAAAWTPCVGPILGSILTLAGTRESMAGGIGLLSIYSLGIAIPFIATALLINSFLAYFTHVKKFMGVIKVICGTLLILMGILLILGKLSFAG